MRLSNGLLSIYKTCKLTFGLAAFRKQRWLNRQWEKSFASFHSKLYATVPVSYTHLTLPTKA